MIINIVSISSFENKKWDILWKSIANNNDPSIIFNKINFTSNRNICECNGIIYLDMDIVCKDIVYTQLFSSDSNNIIYEKLSVFINDVINSCKITKELVLNDECKNSLMGIQVEINGKNVSLNKDDIILLDKMYLLMEKFNYKIKNVIINEN